MVERSAAEEQDAQGNRWTAEAAAGTGLLIRRLRGERGLSLSELARRAGIGKATLSGLETGTRNPTAETLYAIAGQLGVPLAALLSAPEAAPTVEGEAVSAKLLEVFRDGAVSTELYRLTIRPGAVQVSPAHAPGVVEYLTVFSGTARVGPVAAPQVVATGEHASWVSDGPHSYAAIGDVPVEASLLIRHPLTG
ncbi:XRE family transcriptional regulator [Streptacidiphilus sp. N1-10]|uniref:XRE family transcriptional regulator n=1 Tax=Streptacidiphilus jeojiensis TaxID=3229225 RepID=A0ABV6XUR3_9ACTN